MIKAKEFIVLLNDEFIVLKTLLKKILQEEVLLEDNILVKSGFLIKRYSLKIGAIKKEVLQELKVELEKVVFIEQHIQYYHKEAEKSLKLIEEEYFAYKKVKLPLFQIFTQYMNNAFYTAKLSVVRVDELIKLLSEGATLHPKESGRNIHSILLSLEKMTSQILRFITLLEQLSKNVAEFERVSYFPTPKMYGRVMSDGEFRKMKERNILSSRKDPTPVFDCSSDVAKRMFSMSPNQRAEFFQAIGVSSTDRLVLFRTRLKPIVGPVPQSNGLREYKFPKNIPVEILQAA